jgi:flagellar protein FlgJ
VDRDSPTPAADREARLQRACQSFEALVVGILLRQMRRCVPESGLLGGDSAMGMYRDMLDQQLANHVSRRGGLGLADVMMRQLTRAKPTSASAEG